MSKITQKMQADLIDGMKMRISAMEAKTNADAKRLELLAAEVVKARYKAEAYKEMLYQILGVDDAKLPRLPSV